MPFTIKRDSAGNIAPAQVVTPGVAPAAPLMGGPQSTDSQGNTTAPAIAVIGDSVNPATRQAGVGAGREVFVSDGGTATVQITASSAGAVKASPGRLCRVLVSTTVTTLVNIYDNTNAAAGTVLHTVPAGAAVGTVYSSQMPAAVGIFVGGAAGSPQLTVSFL